MSLCEALIGGGRLRSAGASTIAGGLLAWTLLSACQGSGSTSPITSLSPVAATPVPLSGNDAIAAPDERTVCTTVSWDHQIHCTSRRGETVAVFGGEGEGPGEYRRITALMRGPAGTIAVSDWRLDRVTVVDYRSGAVVQETRVNCAIVYRILRVTTRTVIGLCAGATFDGWQIENDLYITEVDMQTAEILRTRGFPHPTTLGVEAECQAGLSWGALRPSGGAVFGTCQREIVFYDDDPAQEVVVLAAPAYMEEFPDERDVEEYRLGMRGLYRDNVVPEAVVREYAETPRRNLLPGQRMVYDGNGRLWTATLRDRDQSSYFDVFEETAYSGSIRVRDRMLGFDIVDSTLVVLVERPVGRNDSDGVPDRAVDWYDVPAGPAR